MSIVRRNVSQRNERKPEAIRLLRKGKITVEQAAKLTGAPISGVVGWMKLAGLPIPPEYSAPRRRPKDPQAARGEPVRSPAPTPVASSRKRASAPRAGTATPRKRTPAL